MFCTDVNVLLGALYFFKLKVVSNNKMKMFKSVNTQFI